MTYKHFRRSKNLNKHKPKKPKLTTSEVLRRRYNPPRRSTGQSYHFRDWMRHADEELAKLRELRRLEREEKQSANQHPRRVSKKWKTTREIPAGGA